VRKKRYRNVTKREKEEREREKIHTEMIKREKEERERKRVPFQSKKKSIEGERVGGKEGGREIQVSRCLSS
jgi:hypothetical protein